MLLLASVVCWACTPAASAHAAATRLSRPSRGAPSPHSRAAAHPVTYACVAVRVLPCRKASSRRPAASSRAGTRRGEAPSAAIVGRSRLCVCTISLRRRRRESGACGASERTCETLTCPLADVFCAWAPLHAACTQPPPRPSHAGAAAGRELSGLTAPGQVPGTCGSAGRVRSGLSLRACLRHSCKRPLDTVWRLSVQPRA